MSRAFELLLFSLLTVGLFWAGMAPLAESQATGGVKSDPASETAILVGAGDIVGCQDPRGALATAKLIEKIPGTVFTLGDMVYDAANLAQFQNCYGTSWGKFRERTRPAIGNHEYLKGDANPYFQYWGAQAGRPGKGYYSYDLGQWHVVVLNTNCEAPGVGGCAAGSSQESWLRQDLHEAGHEHSYERFAPQDPDGRTDPQHGIREIVVGTGGRSHYPLGRVLPNSEVQNFDTYGVLKLTLSPQGYTWEFIPEEGKSFHDSGAGVCQNRAPQQARTNAQIH